MHKLGVERQLVRFVQAMYKNARGHDDDYVGGGDTRL